MQERELMYSRIVEQGILIGDGSIEATFSRDNWQVFSYDRARMRFAIRPTRRLHYRMTDSQEVFLSREECQNCLWDTKEPMVFLMDCYMPDAMDFCVFSRNKLMSEAEFINLYPRAESLLLS